MKNQMLPPVLGELTRVPEVESRHRGDIEVVDEAGRVQRQLGDLKTLVCLRSLAKPFQALLLITTSAAAAFSKHFSIMAIWV